LINWQAVSFDWNQVRAFLATAEEGSLSAAARALQATQPTLSRQVSALEQDLGVTLFERGHRSMDLTESGVELLEHVREMGEAALRVSLAASGQAQDIEGQVTITATNMFATKHLPLILASVRDEAPGLEIEILTSNDVRDLRRREADISIRHARPEHSDLIAKRIGETVAQLYAATSYLDRVGRPKRPSDLVTLDFIGFEDPELMLPHFNAMGVPVTRDHFKLYTASGTLYLALIEQGLGAGVLTKDVADERPDLELVEPNLPPFEVPVWLVTHRELHTSRKIRLVFDLIADYVMKHPSYARLKA
jgi:DNA-binding transcriptional LysR family regulator